jgi:hypothetical protein
MTGRWHLQAPALIGAVPKIPRVVVNPVPQVDRSPKMPPSHIETLMGKKFEFGAGSVKTADQAAVAVSDMRL